MNTTDICHLCQSPELGWDKDNSDFILGTILPVLHLSDADKRVISWAYSPWPILNGKTYEHVSDGETLVRDLFIGGAIKSPAGVAHDFLNRIPNHTTPDGHKWTRSQANRLYLRVMKAIGYPFMLRWRRYLGVAVTRFWWR